MAKRYESLDGSDIIAADTMEAMAKDASECGWIFTWHTDRKMVTVVWDEENTQTYILQG